MRRAIVSLAVAAALASTAGACGGAKPCDPGEYCVKG
jgi:hypothetical protein